ncbi:MAG: leucine-rich repeat domain-containing protein [Candidatus Pacebacteria bacterium]|nr:leucine-rich repeat domain-containing protein [Candidatus Paceibacterota bacterium]
MHELSNTTIAVGVSMLLIGGLGVGYLLGRVETKSEVETTTAQEEQPKLVREDVSPKTEPQKEAVPEKIPEVAPEVGDVVATLNMSNKELTTLPRNLFERTDLVILNLSHNALTGAMPAEIRHLKALTWLDLSYNQFTGVPAEIGQLSNLRHLDLSHNNLTGLPHELGNLQKLEVLDLTGNRCSPEDIATIRASLPSTTIILNG